MATPIEHAPRATLAQIRAFTVSCHVENPEFTDAYDAEIVRLGTKVGIDPCVVKAQWAYETGKGSSEDWLKYGNPAGLGHLDDGRATDGSFLSTKDPLVAARAHIVHLAGYLYGPDGKWLRNTIYKRLDPRWDALLKSGMMGTVTNVEDLGGGTWSSTATSKEAYASGVLGYMKSLESVSPVLPAGKPSIKPYILLDAGHRETGSGGLADSDPVEAGMTQFLAQEYLKDFKADGYPVDWFQATLDHDDLPDLTRGNLDTVALGLGAVLRARHDPLSIMISCHYNGPHSPLHVIVPDVTGLTTAYQGGAPADDTAGNNVWDVQLATMIAANLHAATGLPLFSGQLDVSGVMSERETGVGREGYRLALFAATADSRAKAIRLIIEHGGHEDDAVRQDDFTQKCGPAVVKAITAFMGSVV